MGEEETDLKSVVAKKGTSFTINLWEDRTRGEQWVPSYDSSVFALTADDFLRTTVIMRWIPVSASSSLKPCRVGCIGWSFKSGWHGNIPLKLDACFSSM